MRSTVTIEVDADMYADGVLRETDTAEGVLQGVMGFFCNQPGIRPRKVEVTVGHGKAGYEDKYVSRDS